MRFDQLTGSLTVLAVGGDHGRAVSGLAYDSRCVEPGFLFVAVRGFATDGHLYLADAVARGASAVVVEDPGGVPPGVAWVQVPDTRLALALLSALFYGHPDRGMAVVGVTGTNGKTTTTHLIRSIYRAAGLTTGLCGTVQNLIGDIELPVEHTTPESLDLYRLLAGMRETGVQAAVLEVSSHALALHRVEGVEFDVAVFTNLTQDHLDFHQDMDDYLAAKAGLFRCLGATKHKATAKFAVVNADDPHEAAVVRECRAPVLRYGVRERCDVWASDIVVTPKGTSFTAHGPFGEMPLRLPLTGLFNVYNALAACAVGAGGGLSSVVLQEGLETLAGVSGRFELVDQGQDFAVLVDYAHTPDGLDNVLRTARSFTRGRLWVVFGCGGDRDRGKRPLMGGIATRLADVAVLTSDNPRSEDPLQILREVEAGAAAGGGSYFVEPDRREAILLALTGARSGDTVVIAGKGHEDYQLVGRMRLPFDDREVARIILEELVQRGTGRT
ncbi:MAG TPA: UDP-N-acetylmuramoyl-L-alanyl-D-glutamate--2,6-diaminopimelate ligase [Spirochaetia bacterium]|nr:UDP-N-acetylmuramoyl-L-alanyl-D-glutamate--2,6-diaminopimelate ligase [Spirochaetia bacterium]